MARCRHGCVRPPARAVAGRLAIVVAIALQVALPDRLSLLNRWVLPGLELVAADRLVIAIRPGSTASRGRCASRASR